MSLSSIITDPLNHSATFAYDNANQLTDTTDRNGRRTTYAYDNAGRQIGETWVGSSPAEVITNTYDAAGQLTSVRDGFAALTFAYDDAGRMTAAATSGTGTGQPAVTLSYAYNQAGARTSATDSLASQGVTSYSYDAALRVTSIAQSFGGAAGPRVLFNYDAASRVTSISRQVGTTGNPTQVNTGFAYDNANRLTTILQSKAVWMGFGYTTTPLGTIAYGCDAANRVTSQTDAEGTATFSYDDTNQLTGVSGSRTESYGYDANGNRNTTGYSTGTGNQLTSGGGYTFTYDNEGNMAAKTEVATGDEWTYSYDYRNRMTGAVEKDSGGATVAQASYTYDALDRRIGTQVDDDGAGPHAPVQTWTVYDGVNPYADFNGSGALQTRYLYGLAVDEAIARMNSTGGVTGWYLKDRLGTVRDVVSNTGVVLDHVVYDSFGAVKSETDAANGDRIKYTGREYGATTGLYYYRARYYDPATGRFIEQDPMGFSAGDSNLYRSVYNAPTNAVDPLGETGSNVYPVGPVQQQFFEEMKKLMAEAMKAIADKQAITAQQYADAMRNINKLRITGVYHDYKSSDGTTNYGNTDLGRWWRRSKNPTTTLWEDYWKIPDPYSFKDLLQTMLHESYHAGAGWWTFWEGSEPRQKYDKAQLWAEDMEAKMRLNAQKQVEAMNQLLKRQAQAIAAEQAAMRAAMEKAIDQLINQPFQPFH